MHHLGVAADEPVRVLALRLALLADLGIAEIGEEDVVHLEVPATGRIERIDGLLVGRRDGVEIGFSVVLVFGDGDVLLGDAEMDRARAGDRNLRRHLRVGGDEFEMLEHRMVRGEVERPADDRHVGLCGGSVELDAATFALDDVEAGEHPHEVEMPPGPAEFAIGHGLEPGGFLHPDDIDDGLVLDALELFRRQGLVVVMGMARRFDGVRPEEAADDIGAIGRLDTERRGHGKDSQFPPGLEAPRIARAVAECIHIVSVGGLVQHRRAGGCICGSAMVGRRRGPIECRHAATTNSSSGPGRRSGWG